MCRSAIAWRCACSAQGDGKIRRDRDRAAAVEGDARAERPTAGCQTDPQGAVAAGVDGRRDATRPGQRPRRPLRWRRLPSTRAVAYRILLQRLASERIGGGRVYDAVIAECARRAGAEALLTFNRR